MKSALPCTISVPESADDGTCAANDDTGASSTGIENTSCRDVGEHDEDVIKR